MSQVGKWFPEVEDNPLDARSRRAVYLKLGSGSDRWVVCQRPTNLGKQDSGAIVVRVDQVTPDHTDAEVAVIANQTSMIKHFWRRTAETAEQWYEYLISELGTGKIVKGPRL